MNISRMLLGKTGLFLILVIIVAMRNAFPQVFCYEGEEAMLFELPHVAQLVANPCFILQKGCPGNVI